MLLAITLSSAALSSSRQLIHTFALHQPAFTMSENVVPHQSTPTLLGIPQEIRDIIYELLFESEQAGFSVATEYVNLV